ncbi:DUF411 domain-containing protein [Limibaculum sp. M0105]|uniref:DUF411 domain-containing protein n=1 Tax=Thermohalobaculum xanthum TaxID=2753746 RepID=A0A8J7SFW2_9RHOB|nr:DUF411 domain-containing protein [Thermohalobaculum xanthum]MBK0398690.1 DUF411 domain-containing protein [Thermohalobaculum xanthum]
MPRRTFSIAPLAFALATFAAPGLAAAQAVEVMKSPTCGCCTAWAEHMQHAGFDVALRDTPDDMLAQAKARLGITIATASCHTAMVEGYVIEGHVPAEDVRRLLAERPDAVGLSVPGMPIGSPGMEMGDAAEPYEVLLLRRDGGTEVFARHGTN